MVLLLTIVGGGVWLGWRTRASLPVLDGAIPTLGLSTQVEVLRDSHGVPHIRAQSVADALFTQGYITAQDRLWQMDLSRRNAEGELSEIFGDRTLRLDIESRTLGLTRVAERALAEFTPDEHRLLDSYVRGVNAFIESHRDRLPLEFLMMRYQPRPWREIDSVAVTLNLATALSQTWETDLMREHIAAKLGKELFSDYFLITLRSTCRLLMSHSLRAQPRKQQAQMPGHESPEENFLDQSICPRPEWNPRTGSGAITGL